MKFWMGFIIGCFCGPVLLHMAIHLLYSIAKPDPINTHNKERST